MQLYMRQKVFTIGDRFNVWDEAGNDRWYVEQELFTWGKTLRIYDAQEREAACVRREVLTLLPVFSVTAGSREIARIVRHFTLFCQEYEVSGPDWYVEGEFLAHEFTIRRGDVQVAAVHKEWLTWGDCYTLEIADSRDELLALAVALAIDCANDSRGHYAGQ